MNIERGKGTHTHRERERERDEEYIKGIVDLVYMYGCVVCNKKHLQWLVFLFRGQKGFFKEVQIIIIELNWTYYVAQT
jgi:hypothetical protein